MGVLIGIVFPYVSVVLFLCCAGYRVITWERGPHKLNWKLYPVPEGFTGQTRYMVEEWLSFKMLFRNNSIIWVGSYGFHLALVAIAFWFVVFLFGVSLPWLVRIGGAVLLGASLYLLAVRTLVKQMRDLSTFVEYFNLGIFVLISTTGLIVLGEGLGAQARAYFLGLLSLRPILPPPSSLFLLHLLLLEVTLVYLPFSKMFHMASKYFTFHELRWTNPYEEKSH